MKIKLYVAYILLLVGLISLCKGQPSQRAPIEQRVDQLLSQMTLQEKINQLIFPHDPFRSVVEEYNQTGIGSYYIWDLADNVTNRNWMQQQVFTNSRLKIPIAFAQESLEGGGVGATVFPMPLSMAHTWNPALIHQVHDIIAFETRICGADRTFSPNINLYTDYRFGRSHEGWGEDPFLTAQMAVAAINGLQGERDALGYIDSNHVLAVVKHFAAYGKVEAGQDGSPSDMSERTLREIYLKQWYAALAANPGGVMASHQELTIRGLPSHGDPWLLKDLLRDELDWKEGFVMSDYSDIYGLIDYRLVETVPEAAALGLNSGVEMDLGGYAYPELPTAVAMGLVSEKTIDTAVRRLLYSKFVTGVMDDPYVDESRINQLNSPRARALAKEVALQSFTLLKNTNNLLPLSKTQYKRIAVIGPLADDPVSQLGGYARWTPQCGVKVVTPVVGLSEYARKQLPGVTVSYTPGCYVMNTSADLLDQALALAHKSDLIIMVVGDNMDTCQESYSFRSGDRANIDLAGGQMHLIDALLRLNKPTVVTMINGRPATFGASTYNALLDKIENLLVMTRPGQEGGAALAEILFGDSYPGGKLVYTWVQSAGQIGGPAQPYYKRVRAMFGGLYTFESSLPLFPFGFGLSYTRFNYSNLRITPATITASQSVQIQATVTNIGSRDGSDVAQLYITDVLASVIRYTKQLFGFEKVFLRPGQSTDVSFTINASDLAFYDANMKLIIEPGRFNVTVAPDSSYVGGVQGFFVVSS